MIVPTENSFIPEKAVNHDKFTVQVKGHYGAEYYSESLSTDLKFYWGNGFKTYTKKKWEKKLRYLANKGCAVPLVRSVTLRSGTNQI